VGENIRRIGDFATHLGRDGGDAAPRNTYATWERKGLRPRERGRAFELAGSPPKTDGLPQPRMRGLSIFIRAAVVIVGSFLMSFRTLARSTLRSFSEGSEPLISEEGRGGLLVKAVRNREINRHRFGEDDHAVASPDSSRTYVNGSEARIDVDRRCLWQNLGHDLGRRLACSEKSGIQKCPSTTGPVGPVGSLGCGFRCRQDAAAYLLLHRPPCHVQSACMSAVPSRVGNLIRKGGGCQLRGVDRRTEDQR
jgi:hypothetical protein